MQAFPRPSGTFTGDVSPEMHTHFLGSWIKKPQFMENCDRAFQRCRREHFSQVLGGVMTRELGRPEFKSQLCLMLTWTWQE